MKILTKGKHDFFHLKHGQGVWKELLRVWLPHLPGHNYVSILADSSHVLASIIHAKHNSKTETKQRITQFQILI